MEKTKYERIEEEKPVVVSRYGRWVTFWYLTVVLGCLGLGTLLLYEKSPQLVSFLRAGEIVNDTKRCETSKGNPVSQELGSDNCDLCEVNWLFIIATGRSGSTTILNMVNLLPNTFLSGETGRAIKQIMTLPYFPSNSFNSHFQGPSQLINGPYKHGTVNLHNIRCNLQNYFRELIGNANKTYTRYVGFKEIALSDHTVLSFMSEIFPCARYIINFRKNITKQHQSYFQRNKLPGTLETETAKLRGFFRNNSKAFELALEDFNVSTFNKLAGWLGFDGCKYSNVVHANNGGYRDDTAAKVAC